MQRLKIQCPVERGSASPLVPLAIGWRTATG
jgi:hypothetical protein